MATNECKINPENNIKKLLLTKNKCEKKLNNSKINKQSKSKIQNIIKEINV